MRVGEVYIFEGSSSGLFLETVVGIIISEENVTAQHKDPWNWYRVKFSNGEVFYLREEELEYHGKKITKRKEDEVST